MAQKWADLYEQNHRRAWSMMANDKTRYSNIAPLPLSASCQLESRRDPNDVRGISPLFRYSNFPI